MNNPNQSYFDKYFDPVVRDIDRVNIYEFENGMDYELTQSGKEINIDSIKSAQAKVLKNLKKDPAYYTNMLAAESVKMFGEYGSGKGKKVKSATAKEAESVKKDGKSPKINKQDSPFGVKHELKGKYKSSGMEPTKKVPGSLNENKLVSAEQEKKLRALANDLAKGTDKQKEGAKALLDLLNREAEFTKEKKSMKNEMSMTGNPKITYNDPAEYYHGHLMPEVEDEDKETLKKIKDTFKFQVTGGREGKPMDKDKKLPPNTKIKKENVNVADSRTIRLTPTTKNQILTLVQEMVSLTIDDKDPNKPDKVLNFNDTNAAMNAANSYRNDSTFQGTVSSGNKNIFSK